MKKSDLKSGMIVSLRDWKEKFILIGDIFCNATGKDFLELSNYDDDLKHNFNDRFDITEVYKSKYPNLMSSFLGDKLELIWEREEVDWSKVPFGTRVRVWDDNKENALEGKFISYYGEEYPFIVFVNDEENMPWRYCELIEQPKEEKEVTYNEIDEKMMKYCIDNKEHECNGNISCGKCTLKFLLENYNVTRKDI